MRQQHIPKLEQLIPKFGVFIKFEHYLIIHNQVFINNHQIWFNKIIGKYIFRNFLRERIGL